MANEKKRILLTGGGSAGHVTPNIALLPGLFAEGYEVHYVGTKDGIEKKLISEIGDVTYHEIEAGKLRRYFSLKNFSDPFRVIKGVRQAKALIDEIKPSVVFSKGGFVSVPVVIAAKKKCPVVCHESDYTPGLANKIASRYADTVCVTFSDTLKYTGKKHAVHTGTPIRAELYRGRRENGLAFTGFSGGKPIILVMGGSLGAQAINDGIRGALPELGKKYDIIHLCGRGKLDESIKEPAYRQYEYITEQLPDLMRCADLVVSRSGANSVFEFMALTKPALFIPLPREASRGDQILNANYVCSKGYAMQMEQKDVTPASLAAKIDELWAHRTELIERMKADRTLDGTEEVLRVIREAAFGQKK